MPKLGIAVVRKLLARTAEEGSRNLLQAAFAAPESHGAYCSECQVKEYAFCLLPLCHLPLLLSRLPSPGTVNTKDVISGSQYILYLHIRKLIR